MGARSTGSHPTTTKADGHLLEYFRQNFGVGGGANSGPSEATLEGLTATGGIVSDYTVGSDVYRAHIFTASGEFSVSAVGDFPAVVDLLVVGAGGGGGGDNSGAGGGGGVLLKNSYTTAASRTYTITIGGGGLGGAGSADRAPGGVGGTTGTDTTFVDPSGPTTYTAGGGGH
jgi:hypothetical protein